METFVTNLEKYKEIKLLVDKNLNNEYQEWLDFYKVLDKPGKQGVVGLFKIKNTDKEIIFKISQYINYLVFHESRVMDGLNEISLYCPHFCKSLGIINCKIDAKYRKNSENPLASISSIIASISFLNKYFILFKI